MKNAAEIKKKINDGFEHDVFGFSPSDIVDALPFEEAKKYLTEEFLSQENAKETWERDRYKTDEDVKKAIIDYLPFAWDKCESERSLSADRSIQHFIAWAWLIDDELCAEIEKMYNTNYYPYGRPILKYISNKFGYKYE